MKLPTRNQQMATFRTHLSKYILAPVFLIHSGCIINSPAKNSEKNKELYGHQCNQFSTRSVASTAELNQNGVHLFCPSLDQINSYISDYNLQIQPESFKCEIKDPRTHLFRTLNTLHRSSYDVPASWGKNFSVMTKNLKLYIQRYVKKISLSNAPESSTVINSYPSEKTIEFTSRILDLNPIEMLSMLVHEVRHIEAPQRIHVMCSAGDMPGTEGACDEILKPDHKNMSSYNIEAYYLAGLAMFNLNFTNDEKMTATKAALALMAQRFNNLGDDTAYFHDVIYVLNNKHQIQVWHPYIHQWLNLNIESEAQLQGDQILRIEAANDAFKILITTKSQRLFSYSIFDGLKSFNKNIDPNIKITEASRIIVPNLDNDLYMALLVDQKLKLISYQNENNYKKIIDYPFTDKKISQEHQFSRIIYGNYNELFLIDQQGRLFKKNDEKQTAPDLVNTAEFNQHGPWVQGSASLTYENLNLVNQKGQIFLTEVLNKRSPAFLLENELEPEYTRLTELKSWSEVKAVKYLQGAFGEYVLSDRQKIIFKAYDEKKLNLQNQLEKNDILDFAIMKTLIPSGLIANLLRQAPTEAQKKCQLSQNSLDPVLYKGMGLNKNGELMFLDNNDQCKKAHSGFQSAKKVLNYKFKNTSVFNEKSETNFLKNGINYKSKVELQLITD